MERNKTIEMLIKFYNMCGSSHVRVQHEGNQQKISELIDVFDGDISQVRNYIRNWVNANPQLVKTDKCMSYLLRDCPRREKEVPQAEQVKLEWTETKPVEEVKEESKTPVTDSQVNYSMNLLEQAVIQLISKTQAERIESEIMGQVESKVQRYIEKEYGPIERKVTTVVDGKKVEVKGVQHEKFDTVLKFVANNEPVFLTGPAGSGKNFLCKQVADALGLNFYFTNAVTQEYKLTGFTDAMGNYHATQFYEAFTKGGLFMLDEMDASIPEVLVILNAAIANRYFDFPAPIGYKEAHKDFRVIAAGNTVGQGASYEYVGRNQLDAASLDRFAIVNIDYSPAIEESVCNGDVELVNFCREFRKASVNAGQKVIVSYRAISRLAKMATILEVSEALQTCLTKGMEKDDIRMVYNNINQPSKYKTALAKLI